MGGYAQHRLQALLYAYRRASRVGRRSCRLRYDSSIFNGGDALKQAEAKLNQMLEQI